MMYIELLTFKSNNGKDEPQNILRGAMQFI